jgi:hypothetical protein
MGVVRRPHRLKLNRYIRDGWPTESGGARGEQSTSTKMPGRRCGSDVERRNASLNLSMPPSRADQTCLWPLIRHAYVPTDAVSGPNRLPREQCGIADFASPNLSYWLGGISLVSWTGRSYQISAALILRRRRGHRARADDRVKHPGHLANHSGCFVSIVRAGHELVRMPVPKETHFNHPH